jgi:hypothetical protein
MGALVIPMSTHQAREALIAALHELAPGQAGDCAEVVARVDEYVAAREDGAPTLPSPPRSPTFDPPPAQDFSRTPGASDLWSAYRRAGRDAMPTVAVFIVVHELPGLTNPQPRCLATFFSRGAAEGQVALMTPEQRANVRIEEQQVLEHELSVELRQLLAEERAAST